MNITIVDYVETVASVNGLANSKDIGEMKIMTLFALKSSHVVANHCTPPNELA